jgi:hypothetical protein
MRCWVTTIMQPILYEFEVVADASAVDSHPVETLDPFTVEAVFFEGRAAEVEAFGCLSFADEEKHDDHD